MDCDAVELRFTMILNCVEEKQRINIAQKRKEGWKVGGWTQSDLVRVCFGHTATKIPGGVGPAGGLDLRNPIKSHPGMFQECQNARHQAPGDLTPHHGAITRPRSPPYIPISLNSLQNKTTGSHSKLANSLALSTFSYLFLISCSIIHITPVLLLQPSPYRIFIKKHSGVFRDAFFFSWRVGKG